MALGKGLRLLANHQQFYYKSYRLEYSLPLQHQRLPLELCPPQLLLILQVPLHEALKYDNKIDFVEKSPSAFLTVGRKNLIEQICAHMSPGKLPNGHWNNKINCAEEALKYTNRSAFVSGNSSAYHGADVNGWLEEICIHMDFNPSSDGDTAYLWRAVGHFFNKQPVSVVTG